MSKKCCIFAVAIPRRGCLRVIGWGSRHIKKAFIDALFWPFGISQISGNSGLSNDRCPRDVYILYARTLFVYACVRTYRRGLRVVGSNFQGNARASKGGTDKSRTPRFFYMYIVLIRTKKLITWKEFYLVFHFFYCLWTYFHKDNLRIWDKRICGMWLFLWRVTMVLQTSMTKL